MAERRVEIDAPPFRLSAKVAYPAVRASAYSGATARQTRYWDQIGLVVPSIQGTDGVLGRPRLYSAADLVALREIVQRLDAGESLQQIRGASHIPLRLMPRNGTRINGAPSAKAPVQAPLLVLLPEPPNPRKWRDAALCRDHPSRDRVFFPRIYNAGTVGMAKAICAGCPVRPECFQACEEAEEGKAGIDSLYGIWAGETPAERIRRRRSGGRMQGNERLAEATAEYFPRPAGRPARSSDAST